MKNCCCLVYDLKTQITANQSHSAARPANILKLLTRQICTWDSWTVCNLLGYWSSFPLIGVDRYFLVLHIVFKSHLTDVSLPWPVTSWLPRTSPTTARLPTSSSGLMGSLSPTSPGALSHVERISHQPCFRNDLTPKIGLERFLPREDIVSTVMKHLVYKGEC